MMKAKSLLEKYLRTSLLHRLSTGAQIKIMERYLGRVVDFSRLVTSPLRDDKNPGCSFYVNYSGVLFFKDWALDETYDIIDIVSKTSKLSFFESVEFIKNNFDHTEKQKVVKSTSRVKQVEVIPRPWTQEDFKYWSTQGVCSSTLLKYGVIAAQRVYVNSIYRFRSTNKNPIYVYELMPNGCKIYRPLADRKDGNRHVSYAGSDCLFGFKQLPHRAKVCIITKSPKDVMALHDLGFYSLCALSESTLIPSNYMEVLANRFTYIFTLLDGDATGKRASSSYSKKYNTKAIYFSGEQEKDTSDNIAKYGSKKVKKWLRNLIAKSIQNEYKNA